MAQFYFHIDIDGRIVEDMEGEEFESLDVTRTAAIRAIREIVGDRIAKGEPPNGGRVIVVDANHRQVMEISFAEAIGLK